MNKLFANRTAFLITISLSLTVGFTAGSMLSSPRQANATLLAAPGSPAPALQEFETRKTDTAKHTVRSSGKTKIANEVQTTDAPPQAGHNLSSQAQWDGFIRSLLSLGATDPRAALAYACQNLTLERKNQAVTMLLSEWVKSDFQAAWQWLSANDPDNRKCLESTLTEIGKVDADSAWRFASEAAQRNPAGSQTAYLSALQGMTYAGKFDEAVSLIGGTTTPPLHAQTDLLTIVASEWGRYEPDNAMAWAQTLPPNARQQVLSSVLESWAAVDPKAVADYAANLPAGDMRTSALTQVANVWVDQAPAEINQVAAWVNQFNGDPSYDPVRYKLATVSTAKQNVSDSLNWANTITDTELRAQALATIIESWQQQDQAGANYFLQTSGTLSPEMRTAVQNKLGF